MGKVIGLGAFQFKNSISRRDFRIFVLLLAVIASMYFYRQRENAQLMSEAMMMFMRVFFYFHLYVVTVIFSKDFQGGFYKQIYTSGIGYIDINLYKTITTLFYSLLYILISAICYIAIGSIQNRGLNFKELGIVMLIYILSGMHSAQYAALISSITANYRKTLLIVFMTYAALTYCNRIYIAFEGAELPFVQYIPCILIDNWTVNNSVDVNEIIVVFVYTLIFFVSSIIISQKKEVTGNIKNV